MTTTQTRSHRREKAIGRRGVRRNKLRHRYPIELSPLWQLESTHRLAALLGLPSGDLRDVCASPTFREFDDASNLGKPARHIEEPTELTLRAHYGLLKLLDRIERPDFLHSATKNRSNISNARAHCNSIGGVVVMDITKFYESTSYSQVKRFFHTDLGCALDVSRQLATLCTVNGHLATGSCVSPLLSFFVHRQMFGQILDLASTLSAKMTLYVDDLTFSGQGATKSLLYQVRKIIAKSGLRTHPRKDASLRPAKAAIITGVVRDKGGIRLRNRHHDAIVTAQDQIADGNYAVAERLKGLMAAAKSVDGAAATRLDSRMKVLETRQTHYRPGPGSH